MGNVLSILDFFNRFNNRHYYKVLGVNLYATNAEIRAAYLRLSKKYHPDKNPSPKALIKFLEIKEAYRILGKSNNTMYYEAVDPAEVEENLQRSDEIRRERKIDKDELETLKKKNAVVYAIFNCVKCKTDISGGGILLGCGHFSCEICSEESEICYRCKKEIQSCQPLRF